MSSMIDVRDLRKRFGTFTAVDGISLQVSRGEMFGFLGPNGAGKTTTLKMLCTLLAPDGGTATVNSFDIVRQRHDVRRSLGITFQDPSLDDQLTARENLLFHAMIYKVPAAERTSRLEEVLRLVSLEDRAHGIVKTFSGGMKRRLELARSLMHRPDVLFLDEPTLGLDPQTRRRIWEFLGRLRRDIGLTLFLTTHYMEEAETCDRVAIIDHGRIVAIDTPEALKQRLAKDVIELQTPYPEPLSKELQERFGLAASVEGEMVSASVERGDEFIVRLIPQLSTKLSSLNVRRPTLEDVFVHLTGRAIRDDDADENSKMRLALRKKRSS
jgi:ABC-2 type transport system ATP-binding protein